MKRTALRKKSKVKTLHRKAWDVFSKWIRKRDGRCVTCGSTSNLQAGHFWHGTLDFDEVNINTQCSGCNLYKHGNLGQYSHYLIEKYGLEGLEELRKRKFEALKGVKRSEQDYLDIIEKYK